MTGFGDGLDVKKKSKMTTVLTWARMIMSLAENSRKPVEEQIWGCKLNPALEMLSFEIPINYPNRYIEKAIGCMNIKLNGGVKYGEILYG